MDVLSIYTGTLRCEIQPFHDAINANQGGNQMAISCHGTAHKTVKHLLAGVQLSAVVHLPGPSRAICLCLGQLPLGVQ